MSLPRHWLIQHTGDEWLATAMQLTDDGRLVQHSPRHIGSGMTPQAALLRVLTPLREAHPSSLEAATALNRIRRRRGISYREAAVSLPVTADDLRIALTEYTESPDTYRAWAHALGISDADFTLALRDLQRELDFT